MKTSSKAIALLGAGTVSLFLLLGINTMSPQKMAYAQANSLDGVCVGAINFARKGRQFDNDIVVNAFIRFNLSFTNGTASTQFSTTKFTTDTNNFPKGFETTSVQSIDYAIANGPFTGSYKLTPVGTTAFPTFNMVPASSGSTFFIQVINDDITGICQKV